MSGIGTWSEDGLAWIELRRPDRLNALDRELLRELAAEIDRLTALPDTRVLLLTGAGERAFCAGADIGEMHAQDADGIRAMMLEGKAVAARLEEADCPVLAVVNGFALGGGCELALACDLVLAAESARFALPEVHLGVIPGWGGSQRLVRRVGYGRAREMVLTGRHVPATEALAWGLADRVEPAERLREAAAALGRELAAKDPTALTAARLALRMAGEVPLSDGLEFETEAFVALFDRPERAAAMTRFLERRSRPAPPRSGPPAAEGEST